MATSSRQMFSNTCTGIARAFGSQVAGAVAHGFVGELQKRGRTNWICGPEKLDRAAPRRDSLP